MTTSLRTGAVLFAKDLQKVVGFYEMVAGLRKTHTAGDHVVLRAGSYELVVHAIPDEVAGKDFIESPLVIREDCTLKLVFFIDSILSTRKLAAKWGGLLHGPDREWRYVDTTVCDGCDPEGNVVQFRQRRVVKKQLKKRPQLKRVTSKKQRHAKQ